MPDTTGDPIHTFEQQATNFRGSLDHPPDLIICSMILRTLKDAKLMTTFLSYGFKLGTAK